VSTRDSVAHPSKKDAESEPSTKPKRPHVSERFAVDGLLWTRQGIEPFVKINADFLDMAGCFMPTAGAFPGHPRPNVRERRLVGKLLSQRRIADSCS
jgi:hypothetical protein